MIADFWRAKDRYDPQHVFVNQWFLRYGPPRVEHVAEAVPSPTAELLLAPNELQQTAAGLLGS